MKHYVCSTTNKNRHPQVVNDCIKSLNERHWGFVFNGAQLASVLVLQGYSAQAIRAVKMILCTKPFYEDDLLQITYKDDYMYTLVPKKEVII